MIHYDLDDFAWLLGGSYFALWSSSSSCTMDRNKFYRSSSWTSSLFVQLFWLPSVANVAIQNQPLGNHERSDQSHHLWGTSPTWYTIARCETWRDSTQTNVSPLSLIFSIDFINFNQVIVSALGSQTAEAAFILSSLAWRVGCSVAVELPFFKHWFRTKTYSSKSRYTSIFIYIYTKTHIYYCLMT